MERKATFGRKRSTHLVVRPGRIRFDHLSHLLSLARHIDRAVAHKSKSGRFQKAKRTFCIGRMAYGVGIGDEHLDPHQQESLD